MQTIRLIKKLVRIQDLTAEQERATAAALNNSQAVIGCITDYLESEVNQIDKELRKPKALYDHAGSGQYVTFRLAERASLLNLLDLLTEEVKVLDDDQSGE
jgi:hypothetical protein